MSDEKVAVPTNTQENPLLHKLTPQQFEASVKFYEADHQLLHEDRQVIAQDLQNVVFSTAFFGYGAGVSSFMIPTAYYALAQGNQATVRRSAPVPRGLIKKPFLSFLIGVTAMMVTNQQVCKYKFNSKIQEEDQSSSNRAAVWKSMDYHQASLFYLYYRKTAENPDFIIQDPRKIDNQSLHKVHYDPHKDPHKDEHFTSTLGLNNGEGLSHWDQIRLNNGFGVSKEEGGSKWNAIRQGIKEEGEGKNWRAIDEQLKKKTCSPDGPLDLIFAAITNNSRDSYYI